MRKKIKEAYSLIKLKGCIFPYKAKKETLKECIFPDKAKKETLKGCIFPYEAKIVCFFFYHSEIFCKNYECRPILTTPLLTYRTLYIYILPVSEASISQNMKLKLGDSAHMYVWCVCFCVNI